MRGGGPWSVILTTFANGRFSLYFSGQVVSNTGTWFQNLALSLVVLEATESAQSLGGVTVAQFLPLLFLSIPAGWVADRVRPRTILLITSIASAVVVGLLAVVTLESEPAVGKIYTLVAVLGTFHAFERVAAQAIIYEIVGPSALTHAVSLSTIAVASARSVGPGLAGIAFQGLGATACMVINSASFVVVFISIAFIRPSRLHARDRRSRAEGGGSALQRNRPLVTLLVVNAVVALLALNLMLVLTSTVTLAFDGNAAAVGAVHALNAIGAILGGLLATVRVSTSVRALAGACAALGSALLLNAAAPSLSVLLMLAPVLGIAIGYLQGVLYAAAQGAVSPAQIGRTMSLVMLGNYGMMPFGAILLGWVIDQSSGHIALLIGGIASLACAGFVVARLGWPRRERE